jgi:sec-independent protein translocase protein TatC
MTLVEHIRELRKRLIVSLIGILIAAVVSFVFYDTIIVMLYKPYRLLESSIEDKILFVNTIYEGFLIKLKVSFLCGVILSMPLHLYNAIKFTFPALTVREKKVVMITLIVSFLLVGPSAYYGYFKIIPISITFLTNAGFIPEEVGLLLSFQRNVFYIFQFLLITLILFQLPLVLGLLMALNLVKRKTLLRLSRYVVVGVFVLAAILTPPDFVSQIGVALPLVLLYFLTLLVAKIFKLGEG